MTHQVDQSTFADMSYTTRVDDSGLLVRRALSFMEGRQNPRLLDIGCGGGDIAIGAARMRPDLTAVALDISPANVAATRAAAERLGVGERVEAACSDYLRWVGEPFDLIIGDNVLHFIEGPDAILASRLANDLRPGGILLATLPIESIGNWLRIRLRRIWRTLPSATDRLAFVLARRIYPNFSPAALADRLPYLRRVPARLSGSRLRETFATQGLQLLSEHPWASPSAFKLEHHLFIWRRR
jgi:2-polyprenyl-3-methyl-5-hydroxy-6-metoxy-1,4-benzoquinol methylase